MFCRAFPRWAGDTDAPKIVGMRGLTPPLVSVVMPVFNAGATVAAAVHSLRAQTFLDWELVAVDDGSSDDTAAVLSAMVQVDPRVRLIRRPHAGLVAALLGGLAAARGRLIARMDADDVCHSERLAAQVRLLADDPALGLASCLVEHGGDHVRQAGFARHVDWLNSLITPEQIALNRFVESPVAHPSVMFRRELLETHGGYRDGPWPEDYELWLRWLERGVRFAKVPRTLLTWNDSGARLSRTDARYAPEAFYALKARHLAPVIARTRHGCEVWVWGAGRVTRARVRRLEAEGVGVAGFIDVDPQKWGRQRDGRCVVGPERLPEPGRALVLGYVAKTGARELIRHALRHRGFSEGADFWMAA